MRLELLNKRKSVNRRIQVATVDWVEYQKLFNQIGTSRLTAKEIATNKKKASSNMTLKSLRNTELSVTRNEDGTRNKEHLLNVQDATQHSQQDSHSDMLSFTGTEIVDNVSLVDSFDEDESDLDLRCKIEVPNTQVAMSSNIKIADLSNTAIQNETFDARMRSPSKRNRTGSAESLGSLTLQQRAGCAIIEGSPNEWCNVEQVFQLLEDNDLKLMLHSVTKLYETLEGIVAQTNPTRGRVPGREEWVITSREDTSSNSKFNTVYRASRRSARTPRSASSQMLSTASASKTRTPVKRKTVAKTTSIAKKSRKKLSAPTFEYEGQRVRKFFGVGTAGTDADGYGWGTVRQYGPVGGTLRKPYVPVPGQKCKMLWRIKYDDDDEEQCDEKELKAILIPNPPI